MELNHYDNLLSFSHFFSPSLLAVGQVNVLVRTRAIEICKDLSKATIIM